MEATTETDCIPSIEAPGADPSSRMAATGALVQALAVAAAGMIAGAVFGFDVHPGFDLKLQISPPVFFWPLIFGIVASICLAAVWATTSSLLSSRLSISASSARQQATLPFCATAFLPILYIPNLIPESGQILWGFNPKLIGPWKELLIMTLSASLVFSLLLLRFPAILGRWREYLRARPAIVLGVLIFIWAAVMCSVEVLRQHFLLAGANTPVFAEALNNIFSEKGLLYSELFQADGSSLLGLHASFIWFLVWPVYRIWPSADWLVILMDVSLALAAIPAYLIARRFFATGMSLLLAAVFLLDRLVFAQPIANQVSEQRFLPFLLLFAIYFWLDKRFWPFAAFSLLALTVREDVGLVLALIGFYSLIRRRSLRWWLPPVAVGLLWFAGMTFYLIPAMHPTGVTRMESIYSELGSSRWEIAKNMILKPWVPIETMLRSSFQLQTIYTLWLSLGFGVVLLSGSIIFAIPALAETLFLPRPANFNLTAVAAAAFPALVLGLYRADRISRRRWNFRIAPTLAVLTIFASMALATFWFSTDAIKPRRNLEAATEIMSLVPDDASVIVPSYMLPLTKDSQDVSGYHQLIYQIKWSGELRLDRDFVVLEYTDYEQNPQLSRTRDVNEMAILHDSVELSADFRLIREENDLRLYARTTAENP